MAGQKRKFLSTLFLVIIIWAGLFFALQVLAKIEPATTGLITVDEMQMDEIGETIGLPTTDIRLVVARIIRVALGFLGVVALVLILYGGFVWMTAGGNEENIQKAKKILVNAAIGLAIILSAYAIASFVINALVGATTGGEGVPGGPGGPPGSFTNVLYITSMPGDDLGCGIRNIHPILTFNKAIDITTVPNNLVIRNKQTGAPANGAWRLFAVDKQNTIVFDPIGDCGVEPPQNDCLDASTTYQIFFAKALNIKSQDALSLNCNVGNYKLQCKNLPAVEFVTGDSVDVEPPTITIINPFNNQSFAQGSVVPVEIYYTDNFGVQNVSLSVNGTPIDSKSISGCQKSGTTTLNWPSGSAPTGTYSLESIVFDNASLFASTTRNIMLLAGHCFDDQLNFGETMAGPPACGGECGACAGESCTENSDCASGWCEDGFCVDRMRINGFSRTAGAVSTTYVSIWGQYFGDDGGHIYFRKSGADEWTEAFVANCGSGIDNWTKSQIIVKVPPDAITGPIKVETAGTEETKFVDITNNDGWGYQGDFTVNDELLPGLCSVVPNYGAPYTNVILIGENFGASQTSGQDNVFFASSTPIIYSWLSNSVKVRVPALGTGAVPVKLMNDNKNSNSIQFNVREVLDSGAPMIESIYPEEGAKGEYITIIGKNFGSYAGLVLFKDGPSDAIYGTTDFPEECEGAIWSDKQIVVKFPTSSVQDGHSYTVQVQRSSDSAIGPIGATFGLQTGDPSPGICKIDPNTGPIPFEQTATMQIFGEYYTRGSTTSVPYFWLSVASPTSTVGRTATGTISVSNTRVVVQPPLDTETGPVAMYRPTDQKMGNSMPFTVYNCLENNSTCADPAYQCCTAGTDAGICRLNTELCDGQTRSTGYMWRFNTGPFPPTARVVERCNSDTDLGMNLPSPSPNIRWSLSENNDHFNVCRTAEITVEFSMRMLQTSVDTNNIQIFKCSTSSLEGAFFGAVNSCEHIGGPIQMQADSYTLFPASAEENANHDYIQMFPQIGKWDDDSYYHVVLKTDIMSTPTSYMYGDEERALGAQNLKAQRPCGAGSAYCFVFKTDARDCKLARVVVTPYAYWTAVLEEPIMRRDIKDKADDPGVDFYYRGTGLSDQKCIMMNMDGYNWDWSVQAGRTSYADLYGDATGTNGNMHQVSALSNTVSVGLLNPEDSANIEATASREGEGIFVADQKKGASPLTIDLSKPRVVNYWPNCLEACTNAEIGAKFNIRMSSYNVDNGVKVYECFDENCSFTVQIPAYDLDMKFGDDSRFLSIVPKATTEDPNPEWKIDTLYLVVLSKTGTSVSDQTSQLWSQKTIGEPSSQGKPMQEAFSWRFRTKSEKCTVDKVTVTPILYRAPTVDSRKVYSSQARSAPDSCDPEGQLLNAWSLDWDWTSSDILVAEIQEFKTKGRSAFCTANCVKKGSSIPYGGQMEPLCGNMAQEAGEDCDPPQKVGDTVICSLNCLRPGNNNTTTTLSYGSTVDYGLCGDGVVSPLKGEKCDPNNPATSAGCTANCLFAGSSPQTGAEDVGASICGNGMIGTGEDCDIGNSPDFWVSTSSLYCSEKCLHLGSSLSSSWCAVNTSTHNGFSTSEYNTACAKAKSICGDGIASPDEDLACETSPTPMQICTDRCLVNVFSDSLKKCFPTTTLVVKDIYNNPLYTSVIKSEGCNSIGQYEGSSLMYSTSSLCGDGVAGIGEDPDCEKNFVYVRNFVDPWALAIGIGLGTTTANQTQITDITATGVQKVDEKIYTESGKGQFEILCGFDSDLECQIQTNNPFMGVADNSCCYERSLLIDTYPARTMPSSSEVATAFDVCPNTFISATFNKIIDVSTLPGAVYIARGYNIATTTPECPVGQIDVTDFVRGYVVADARDQIQPWYKKLWAGFTGWVKNLFGIKASADTPRSEFNANIYCVGDESGTPEVIVPDPKGVNSTSTVRINLNKPLAFDSDYAIIFRPGAKDVRGVSVGNTAQWQFITGNEICVLDKVEIDPDEHMFNKSNVTQNFEVKSISQNSQFIQPVAGYSWEYDWGPAQNEFIAVANATGTLNVVTAKNRNGEVDLTAVSRFTENIFPIASPVVTGKSRIVVFLCENRWPSGSIDNFPFIDEEHDFSTYYCMDYGMVGIADDLPNVTTSQIWTPSIGSPYVKRYIFINNNNKDAIGIQIFYNSDHLSIGDWYASQGYTGQMNSVKIDGFDALTDGNNYYIDALIQPLYTNPTIFNIYSNIYQFSINSDATAHTKEVFSQIIKYLKFNLRLKNDPYCSSDYNGANIDYGMQCSNDMDCLAQMEAIKKVSPTTTKSNYFCYNQKDKLQRNYTRLNDLRGMIKSIEWGRGAVAIWPMDYVTYGKLPDSTGRGFEAVINESTGKVSLLGGRISQALHIEQPAYLVATKATDIGNRSFTVAHWIKTTSSQYRAYTVTNDTDPNSANNRYYFGISDGKVGYRISYNGSDYLCSADKVNNNLWHHIAVVFDRQVGQTSVSCYVDGIVSGSASYPSSFINMYEGKPRIGTPICSGVGNCMKCSSSDTDCDSVFKADIDDVRIYARALSPDEMRDLFYDSLPYNGGYPNLPENTYLPGQAFSVWPITWSDLGSKLGASLPVDPINKLAQSGTCFLPVSGNQYEACYRDVDCATVPTDGRSSYWTADEGNKDEGTIGNNAIIDGSVQTVSGKGHGKAFEFAGDSSAKVVASNFDEYNGDSFSVSAWIYPTKRNTATIIKKGGSDGDGNSLGGFVLEYSGLQFTGTQVRFNNGTIRFAIFPDASNPNKYYAIDSVEPLGVNQWYFITATYDNNTREGKLYINGVLEGNAFRAPPNGVIADTAPPVVLYATNTLDMEIGESFNGKIDNISFYSRDLNITEIGNLYAGLCILHDPETGWSAEDRRFSFACNTSSYAYRYSFVSTTKSYLLRANLETLQSPEPQNYFNFNNDFTSNKVLFEYGVCASASEISSPYNVYCGDGILGSGEECDPPGSVSYNTTACPSSATKKICNSQCAWGVTAPVTCVEAIGGICGDGKIQYSIGEVCDDGLLNGQPGRCSTDCTGVFQTCGNEDLDSGEFCDTVVTGDLQKCTYRPGVSTIAETLPEPIYYFLVDFSGSMLSVWGGKTRMQYVKEQLAQVGYAFANVDTKAKIGIGVFSNTNAVCIAPTPVRHLHEYLETDFYTGLVVSSTVNNPDFTAVEGCGTWTGSGVKWFREEIYPNLSETDRARPINLVLVVDGDESGSASLPKAIDEIPQLTSQGILTYVLGVGYSNANFNLWAELGGTVEYIPISQATNLADVILSLYYSRPCRQYSQYSGYSCNWNCTGFGGYCGDGLLQTDSGEQCEGTAPVPCTTDGGYSGTAQCLHCQLQECIADSPPPVIGECGNEIVDEFEACDRGSDENGIICTPIYPQTSCTYCSADCKNVITNDIICGNGILDEGELCDPGALNRGYVRTLISTPYTLDICLPCKSDCTGWNVSGGSVNSILSGCAIYGVTSNPYGRGYCGDGIRQQVFNIDPFTGLLIPPYPWLNDYEECDMDTSVCPACPMYKVKNCNEECECTCQSVLY